MKPTTPSTHRTRSQTQQLRLGAIQPAFKREMHRLLEREFVVKLWQGDHTGWEREHPVPTSIGNWLGWLRLPDTMANNIPRLEKFAARVRADGFKHVVLLGMGGSSLAPIVLGSLFKPPRGFPHLRVLDSTDPAAVAAVENAVDIAKALFIVASKSGTTIESDCFYRYFRDRARANGARWAEQFVVITDEATPLHKEAVADELRDVFIAPNDVGGRYSALSYFGLVPAACIGIPLNELLAAAREMSAQSKPEIPLSANPGFQLGVALGAAALRGHDKLTLVIPRRWQMFGLWIEQLIAESTGKDGRGILPVTGEKLGTPDCYGNDRFFVQLRVVGTLDLETDRKIEALRRRGMPVAVLTVGNPLQIGAEFFRWEIATATAGAILGINPFDQPNVQAAKEQTNKIIAQFVTTGKMPLGKPSLIQNGIAAFCAQTHSHDAVSLIHSLLATVRASNYIALLAYLPVSDALERPFRRARLVLRNKLRAATTFSYGPRYLHSTGQFHKGGPNNGVFIIITANPKHDLAIPGKKFSFGQLEMAQALGDAAALRQAGRRVLHFHLPAPDIAHVKKICSWLEAAVSHGFRGKNSPAAVKHREGTQDKCLPELR